MLTFPSLVGRRNCCTHFEPRDSALMQASIVQIGLERQHLVPTSHILDKRLPIPGTQTKPVLQGAHENPFSFARRSFLHRKRHMSYNASAKAPNIAATMPRYSNLEECSSCDIDWTSIDISMVRLYSVSIEACCSQRLNAQGGPSSRRTRDRKRPFRIRGHAIGVCLFL